MKSVDWESFMQDIQKFPPKRHRLQPPCPRERIEAAEIALGQMPADLIEMLARFNGAKLFVTQLPFITLFGVTTIPPLSPLEWARDWYIDRFTTRWRDVTRDRRNDWVIAITSYGGLMIINRDGMIREWDTGTQSWNGGALSVDGWLKRIVIEGELVLRDCED